MSRVEAIHGDCSNFTRRDLLGRKDSGQLKEYGAWCKHWKCSG